MGSVVEHFIRNSDNQIKLLLTEDGDAVFGAWTALDIYFGGVTIHRTVDGDGVELSAATGILAINPGDLTAQEKADIDALVTTRLHRVEIVVTSLLNNDGAVFGGRGCTLIYFHLSDLPS